MWQKVWERIDELRNSKGWFQKELSFHSGIKQQHLSNLKTGRSGVSIETIEKIADVLDTTPEYLLYGVGDPNKTDHIIEEASKELVGEVKQFLKEKINNEDNRVEESKADYETFPAYELDPRKLKVQFVPLLGEVPAGDPTEQYLESHAEEWIPIPEKENGEWPKLLFALRVKGDSMSEKINEGDLIVVNPEEQPETGQIAVVQIDDESTVKRVICDKKTIRLLPANSSYQEETYELAKHKVRIVGKVIFRVEKLG